MLFTIKLKDETVRVGGRTHESSLISTRDPTWADDLFAALPKKAVVAGVNSSKSYKITREKPRKKTFPGARYAFSVEESGLGPPCGCTQKEGHPVGQAVSRRGVHIYHWANYSGMVSVQKRDSHGYRCGPEGICTFGHERCLTYQQ